MEIWKDIIGYEGLYQVSNMGRVRSADRLLPFGKHKKVLYKGKIKTIQYLKKSGHAFVYLWKENKMKVSYVHRLVAQAFIHNPKNYPIVMHIDNNPANNLPSNLQWGTQTHNMQHTSKCGRVRNQYS
jgi:hypothetical protein